VCAWRACPRKGGELSASCLEYVAHVHASAIYYVTQMTSLSSEACISAREIMGDIREKFGVGEDILQETASNRRIQRVFSNQKSLTQNAVRE